MATVSGNAPRLGTGGPIWGATSTNLGGSADFMQGANLYGALRKSRDLSQEEYVMPRYVVEREFPNGLLIPVDENGARACVAVVDSNLSDQVTWIHSYVSADKKKTFCVYDAPSPEAIRRTAGRSKLPVGHITEVRVLDPYFYK